MTLFCVKDGDPSSDGWNQPLKKVVPPTPVPPKYVPTETKGIVRNTETGKLETDFPELEPPALVAPPLKPTELDSDVFLLAEALRKQVYQDMLANTFKQFESDADWRVRQIEGISTRSCRNYAAKISKK
jgi:hypothetical protein